MYYLGVFPAKSRASAEAAQILQLTDSVLKRHRAQREQGREDRSLVPVITYNSAHRWAELPAVLMKHTFFFKLEAKSISLCCTRVSVW